jgi:hypothetical protein
MPAGTVVAMIVGSDPDGNQTLSYSRTQGPGSADNESFQVGQHGRLRTNKSLDFETHSTMRVRLRVVDEHNASFSKSFVISVLNDSADDISDQVDSVVDQNVTTSIPNSSNLSHEHSMDGNATDVHNVSGTLPGDGNHTGVDGNQTGSSDQNKSFLDGNNSTADNNGQVQTRTEARWIWKLPWIPMQRKKSTELCRLMEIRHGLKEILLN